MGKHNSTQDAAHPSGKEATLGRPKESGSRQQTHPDQGSQSGSHEIDERASHGRTPAVPARPAGAK
jgi:hypothetical protein